MQRSANDIKRSVTDSVTNRIDNLNVTTVVSRGGDLVPDNPDTNDFTSAWSDYGNLFD